MQFSFSFVLLSQLWLLNVLLHLYVLLQVTVASRIGNNFVGAPLILIHVIMLEKYLLTVLELIWNQRLGHKKTKLNICHHMLTSSTQLQNRSFHVVERTRTSTKCQKMKNARAKRAKILFFIVKYANLWGFCCRRRRGCLSSLLRPVYTGDFCRGNSMSQQNCMKFLTCSKPLRYRGDKLH